MRELNGPKRALTALAPHQKSFGQILFEQVEWPLDSPPSKEFSADGFAAAVLVRRRDRHRRRAGRFYCLHLDRPARTPRPALRARALPAFPHRRVADPADLLGA